jgi:hypothetical protein
MLKDKDADSETHGHLPGPAVEKLAGVTVMGIASLQAVRATIAVASFRAKLLPRRSASSTADSLFCGMEGTARTSIQSGTIFVPIFRNMA